VGERRDVKFRVQVYHSKSQPIDKELSLKGVWSCHVTHFKFLGSTLLIWANFLVAVCSYSVNKYLWECIKTHHFDIRNTKIFWRGGGAQPPS